MRKPRHDSFLRLLIAGILTVLVHCAGLTTASAQSSVTLEWNPNPEPNITGYRLHIGTRSGTFDEVRTLGKSTSTVVTDLAPETTYFFALQAVNDAGLASTLSAAISLTTAAVPKPAIQLADEDAKSLSSGQDSLDFGSVLPGGGSSIRTVVVSNSGNARLDGISFRISGVNAADFKLSSTTVATLEPGASQAVSFAFTPGGEGLRRALLSIVSNDQERSPFEIPLSGIGTTATAVPSPALSVSTPETGAFTQGSAEIRFGGSAVHETSETRALAITNSGTAPLANLSIMVSGSHAADFRFSPLPSMSLASGETTVIGISFQPSGSGTRSATLRILSNDPSHSPFDIALTGTGVAVPEITVERGDGSPMVYGSSSLAFGSATPGAGGPAISLVVRNTGSGDLTTISLGLAGSHPGDFTVSSVPTTIAAGGSASFTVTFRPGAAGSRSAVLRIASNDGDRNPFDIALTGTGMPVPEIAVERGDGTPLVDGSSSLAFGTTNLGAGAPAVGVVIRNTGTADLAGLGLTLAGTHPGDFTVSSIPTTIAAGGSASFTVTFRPGAAGSRSAVLRIASNDADENPFDITLTGTGVAVPEIAVERGDGTPLVDGSSSLAFATTNLGAGAPAVGVVIRNTGTADLAGLGLTLAGTHPGDFTVSSIPTTIAAGGSASFTVTFRPGAAGARSAVLRIASNDADENPFDITLTGSGVPVPEIAVERGDGTPLVDGASTLSLGSANLGTSGPTVGVVIRNTGTADLTGIALALAGSHPGDFTVSSVPTNIGAGGSATFTVTFRPGAAGARSAVLRIASNDADENPFDITLAGTGVAVPEIAVNGPGGFDLKSGVSSIAFSSLDLAATGETKVFTIRNEGTATLSGIRATIAGSHITDFTASSLSSSLPPGGSAAVSITFRPTASGARSALLQIASNDADENPFTVFLLGNGTTSPEIEVTRDDGTVPAPDGEHFGSVPIGGSGSITMRIHNRGTARLDGIHASVLGTNPQDFVIPATPVSTLAPGAHAEITLRFEPRTAGPRNAILRISSNDVDENPLDVPLTGIGIAFPDIEISGITPATDAALTLDFGTAQAGIAGDTRSFTIRNTGTAPLTGLTAGIEGGNRSEFSITQPAPQRLAPGAAATVRIRFQPYNKGTKTANLIVRSNDADEAEILISLTGVGLPAPRLEIRSTASGILRNGNAVVNFGSGDNPRMASRMFTLTNRGSAPLTGIRVVLSGLHAGDFQLIKPAYRTLRPGQSAGVRVIFDPTRPGTRWAALRITSNDPSAESFDIVLTGRASGTAASRKAPAARSKSVPAPFAKDSSAVATKPIASVMIIDGKRYRCITIPKTRGTRVQPHLVEVSGNLVDWASGPRHVTVVADNPDFLKVRDKTPIPPGGKRHIRLRQLR